MVMVAMTMDVPSRCDGRSGRRILFKVRRERCCEPSASVHRFWISASGPRKGTDAGQNLTSLLEVRKYSYVGCGIDVVGTVFKNIAHSFLEIKSAYTMLKVLL